MKAAAATLLIRNDLIGHEHPVRNELPRWLLIETMREQLAVPAPATDAIDVCCIAAGDKVVIVFHAALGSTDEEALAATKGEPVFSPSAFRHDPSGMSEANRDDAMFTHDLLNKYRLDFY